MPRAAQRLSGDHPEDERHDTGVRADVVAERPAVSRRRTAGAKADELRERPADDPGLAEDSGDRHGLRRALVVDGVAEHRQQVVVLAVQLAVDGRLEHVVDPLRGVLASPAQHRAPRVELEVIGNEAGLSELADGLQHPEPQRAGFRIVRHDQQRLRDEAIEQVLRERDAEHRRRGRRRESGGQQRECRQRSARLAVDEVPAPLDDCLERAVPLGCRPVAGREQGESVAQPRLDLLRRHAADARGGELDRERQSVQALGRAAPRRRAGARHPGARHGRGRGTAARPGRRSRDRRPRS